MEAALQAGDQRASYALGLIALIYDNERQATEDQVSVEERTRRRQLGTRPIIDQLRGWGLTAFVPCRIAIGGSLDRMPMQAGVSAGMLGHF